MSDIIEHETVTKIPNLLQGLHYEPIVSKRWTHNTLLYTIAFITKNKAKKKI